MPRVRMVLVVAGVEAKMARRKRHGGLGNVRDRLPREKYSRELLSEAKNHRWMASRHLRAGRCRSALVELLAAMEAFGGSRFVAYTIQETSAATQARSEERTRLRNLKLAIFKAKCCKRDFTE